MTASNRLAMTVAAAAVSVTLASGCAAAGGAHPASSPSGPGTATASFSAMGLAFRYPAAWRLGRWSADVSSFTALIVDLSTSRLKDPCSVTSRPGRKILSCGFPVDALPPGGILVIWNDDGFPFRRLPEPNTTIAGRKARETRTSGAWCATLHGTETITVMIPRNVPDNWYEMDACLRVSIRKSREWACRWPAWQFRGAAPVLVRGGVIRAAGVAAPRCGGLRGWRSRAGSVPVLSR